MKIIVLVKQVPDTWFERSLDLDTGRVDRTSTELVLDEINERALEVALQYKDANKATEITVLTMGPASAGEVLRRCLAVGADRAIHVRDDTLADADAVATAQVLAAAIAAQGFDLVLTGNLSTDGRGGVVPSMIAEILAVPCLSSFSDIVIDEESVRGVRQGAAGALEARADLPAIVSVNEAAPEVRFPGFKGILAAKKKPIETLDAAQLGVIPNGARSRVVEVSQRPARSAGTVIVDEGDAGTALAEFLVSNRLI